MSRSANFTAPSNPTGNRLVRSRFSLRREPETRKVVEVPPPQPTATYSNPGRGPNGESSN